MTNDKREGLLEMIPMECPKCKREIKPQYTDRYLEQKREYTIRSISLTNYELQCPRCNAIFPCSPIEYVPLSASPTKYDTIKVWFSKFLP